jgi:hypothetical protein
LPSDSTHFQEFLGSVLPHVSGPGFTVPWADVDACGDAPCGSESDFSWSVLDSVLTAYIDNVSTPFSSGCAGARACRLVLIVQPTSDSGNDNQLTPAYVFSPGYAGSLSPPAPPQDVMICNEEQGHAGAHGGPLPITGTFGNGDVATWNADHGSILAGSGLSVVDGGFPTTNFSGYPVEYEAPFRTAYENFIKNLLIHYSPAGSGDGPRIAPLLAYIRFGLHGGENDPTCTQTGTIPTVDWASGTTYEAGEIVRPSVGNPGNFTFVAQGAGKSGGTLAPPWCQTAYCDTSSDGTIVGWRNTGFAPGPGLATSAMWPGPAGQAAAPHGFTNQEYLDFVRELYTFIAAQQSSVPLDIASHDGPPYDGNWAYADSEAIAAVGLGLGFGNEGLSLDDPLAFAASMVPSSPHDWVENFDLFAGAPVVRHLQTIWPGGNNGIQAEAFSLSQVSVAGGMATATCADGDCSIFCTGRSIEVSGSSQAALDGTWPGSSRSCAAGRVVFPVTGVPPGTYPGGTIWASDYLPVTLPFAKAHAATAFELHECTLDYAFGVETVGSVAKACAGLAGPDTTYQALLSELER